MNPLDLNTVLTNTQISFGIATIVVILLLIFWQLSERNRMDRNKRK